jgi:CheY-like chemotaxis protein
MYEVPSGQKEPHMNHALLYIEDDEQNVALIEAVLRRRPQVELHVAMNGRDGVRAAIDLRPALILLDNRLPDTTGREILQELAASSATAAIPVVILSGDSDEIINELLASGAAESVAKPFSVRQFIGIIDRYLA